VRGWRFSEEPSQVYGISDEWAARLVSQIDVLTLSHFHADHCDPAIRDLAFAKGIPVVADPSIYPEIEGQPLLIRPMRLSPEEAAGEAAAEPKDAKDQKDQKDQEDPKDAGKSEALKRLGVSIIAYPGHQGLVAINNCYLIRTPEGLTFLHTGDQFWAADWPWIDRVGDRHKVDVLLVNCFTAEFDRMIRGVRPSLVVTGHENEMAHFPDHRETFWRSFQQFRGIESQPMAILCWGEGVVCPVLEGQP
jgi:L-ascorbate metabolism protein UlaG (beta-lactamase superfamily)